MSDKIKLHGFNNLTKSLSFNIYDICYAKTKQQRKQYVEYIDEVYNSSKLIEILKEVTKIIDAEILNIAYQDFDPQGSSVTMLISEEPMKKVSNVEDSKESPGPLPETVLAHLDKSHLTVHTYPEIHPHDGICTFRVDIDVSTCGVISPLKALNYLIHSFDSDIVTVDYRVRGFTRDIDGRKIFMDHDINSIQNYLTQDSCEKYQMIDVNVYQENLFHTKMLLKQFDLDDYLFGISPKDLMKSEEVSIREQLRREMLEIFYGCNFTRWVDDEGKKPQQILKSHKVLMV